MKKLVVSLVKTSVMTSSCVGSESDRDQHGDQQREADGDARQRPEGPGGAQLDQLREQQRPHPLSSGSPVSSRKTSSSERETWVSSESATRFSFAAAPTCSAGGPAGDEGARGIVAVLDAGRVKRSRQGGGVRGGDADRAALASRDDLIEGTARAQLSLRDHHHVVGGLRDLREKVARDEHRPALVGLGAKHVAHPADARRVEPVGGLVEDQDFGVAQQRRRDREALAHPHRVALDPAVAGVGDADDLRAPPRRARAGGRRPRPGSAGGCAPFGPGGSSRPRARRRRGRSGARGPRRRRRRIAPCRYRC